MKRLVLVSFDDVSDRIMDELISLLDGSEHRIVIVRFRDPENPISVSQPEEDWSDPDTIDGSLTIPPTRERERNDRPDKGMRSISPVLLKGHEEGSIRTMLDQVFTDDLVISFIDSASTDLVFPASYFSGSVMRKNAFSLAFVVCRGPIPSKDRLEGINRLFLDLGLYHHGVVALPPAIHRERRMLELAHVIRHLGTLVFKPGLINLDLADLLITSKGGTALIVTWGMAQPGGNPSRSSVRDALRNPLCDVNLSTVRKALVHVMSNRELTLEDSIVSTEYLRGVIKENARIIWGVTLSEDPDDEMEVLLVLATTPIELLLHWYGR